MYSYLLMQILMKNHFLAVKILSSKTRSYQIQNKVHLLKVFQSSMMMMTYLIIYPQSHHSIGEIIMTIELLITINKRNLLHKFPVNPTRIGMRVSLEGTSSSVQYASSTREYLWRRPAPCRSTKKLW